MALLIGVAVLLLAGELYFFLMQRSALEVCRFSAIPASAVDLLLPPSYGAAWIFAWGKWIPIALSLEAAMKRCLEAAQRARAARRQ